MECSWNAAKSGQDKPLRWAALTVTNRSVKDFGLRYYGWIHSNFPLTVTNRSVKDFGIGKLEALHDDTGLTVTNRSVKDFGEQQPPSLCVVVLVARHVVW